MKLNPTSMSSPGTDEGIFAELLSRLEPELPTTERRYEQLRLKLVKFFSWKMCRDPESLADETITRLLQNLNAGREILADNPYSYVYGIARNLFREYLRAKKRNEELLDGWQPTPPHEEELQDCRSHCLNQISPEKLHLLTEYYSHKEKRELAAQQLGLSLNALRLKVFRARNELKACYERCMKKLSRDRN